jgi:hypothetical protein
VQHLLRHRLRRLLLQQLELLLLHQTLSQML